MNEYQKRVYALSPSSSRAVIDVLTRYVREVNSLVMYHYRVDEQIKILNEALARHMPATVLVGDYRHNGAITPDQVHALDVLLNVAELDLTNQAFIFVEDFVFFNTHLPEWV